jgi:ribosomal protein L9
METIFTIFAFILGFVVARYVDILPSVRRKITETNKPGDHETVEPGYADIYGNTVSLAAIREQMERAEQEKAALRAEAQARIEAKQTAEDSAIASILEELKDRP